VAVPVEASSSWVFVLLPPQELSSRLAVLLRATLGAVFSSSLLESRTQRTRQWIAECFKCTMVPAVEAAVVSNRAQIPIQQVD
jgi:hypothetical protein